MANLISIRRYIFLTLFFVIGFIVSYAQNDSLKEVIIYGEIAKSDVFQTLTFRFYKDYLTFDEIHYTVSIKNDSFFIKIPIKESTPGFIAYGERNVPIFLEIGDSLIVQSNAKSFSDSLKYSGIGALANIYLQQTFLLFDGKDVKRVEQGIAQNTAKGFQNLMRKFKQEKIDFLDSFLIKRDTQFTPSFDEYVKADINYWFGYNLMRYRSEHPASDILPVALTLPDEYFGFMDSLQINNESVLKNINYLFYLEHFAKWRQDRIEKGLLQFKNVSKTTKKLIKINLVETFGKVLIDQLEVRAKAHDPSSVISKLERGTEVIYLQDITNDRFSYPYGGQRYSDRFLKIELADGRWGWVFRGGIHLKERVVYAKKWVTVPDTSPEVMRNYKYASFKGKVLHYAIAKDLYWDATNNTARDKALIADYLKKAPEDEYTSILKEAMELMDMDSTTATATILFQIPLSEIENSVVDTTHSTKDMLKEITAIAAKNFQIKNKKTDNPSPIKIDSASIKVLAKPVVAPQKIAISKPDFRLYAKVTTLHGRTNSATLSRPEIIINTNPLLREGTSFPFPDATATNFQYDISLKSNTTAELKMGKESIDLFLQAGDDLDIAINGNNLSGNTIFSGKGSKSNNYLVAAANRFRNELLELEVKIRYAKPAEFKLFIKEIKDQKHKFLRTYLESQGLSAAVIKFARADIDYWYAFNLMNYPYEHPIFHDEPSPMLVPTNYYDFVADFEVNNAGALPNKYYLYYLQDFLSYQAGQSENNGLSRFELADKFLEGKPLYFYKALQLSLEAKQNNEPNITMKIADFIENCPYKLYNEYVKLAYHEGKGIVEGMEAPDFSLIDINGKSVALEDFRGKVVFLDFWATWCVPCIHQLPSHQKLQSQFQGQEVAFLYVTVDRNKGAWERFVRNKNLPGVHLTAGENMFNSSVAKKYRVSSLPYTVLIDPYGKIVWHHIGGYSVQRVGQRISELLQ